MVTLKTEYNEVKSYNLIIVKLTIFNDLCFN